LYTSITLSFVQETISCSSPWVINPMPMTASPSFCSVQKTDSGAFSSNFLTSHSFNAWFGLNLSSPNSPVSSCYIIPTCADITRNCKTWSNIVSWVSCQFRADIKNTHVQIFTSLDKVTGRWDVLHSSYHIPVNLMAIQLAVLRYLNKNLTFSKSQEIVL